MAKELELKDLLENEIINYNKSKFYSVILGSSPSKGARSPKLWNAAFNGLKFPGVMHPFDVLPKNLGLLIDKLREDKRFIGGSVTMPYKTDVIKFIDEIEEGSKRIGAINCIYRGKNGKLIGSNTDGAAALWSLQSSYGDLNGAKILLLGAGGAAAAVASYVGQAVGRKGKLYLSNRSKTKASKLKLKLSNVCDVECLNWPVSNNYIKGIDVIINCSSIGFETPMKDKNGFYSLKFYSPIAKINNRIRLSKFENLDDNYFIKAGNSISENFYDTKKFLSQYKNLLIFDIVYQPKITSFLYISNLIGHKIITGSEMNLEQAVIAFFKTISATENINFDIDKVRKYMKKAN